MNLEFVNANKILKIRVHNYRNYDRKFWYYQLLKYIN